MLRSVYDRHMPDPVPLIEAALVEADSLIRERFKDIEVDHLILAVAPDGAAVIRSNCGPKMLRHLADLLNEIADEHTPPADRKHRH